MNAEIRGNGFNEAAVVVIGCRWLLSTVSLTLSNSGLLNATAKGAVNFADLNIKN